MKIRATLAVLAVIVTAVVVAAPTNADTTEPYGDNATARIADRLHGKQRGGWLATTLDIGGYHGKRHAEVVKIPAGHGKRWVGIIHVPSGNAAKARRALAGAWFAQNGTRFVLPLRAQYYTDGGPGQRFRTAARWAARRLGGWKVVAP
jgi:hypothetical protein